MDQAAMQAWFRALPDSEKILLLVELMFYFTIVIRGVFHYSDKDERLKAAYSLSEFNHMLTSKVRAMLQGTATYPDDLVIKELVYKFSQPELEPYFSWVWNPLVERANLRPST
jgi:hypothetical protein